VQDVPSSVRDTQGRAMSLAQLGEKLERGTGFGAVHHAMGRVCRARSRSEWEESTYRTKYALREGREDQGQGRSARAWTGTKR
jgi:hypothetical protein